MPYSVKRHQLVRSVAASALPLTLVPFFDHSLTLLALVERSMIVLFFGMITLLSAIAARRQSHDPALPFISSTFSALSVLRCLELFLKHPGELMSASHLVSTLLFGLSVILFGLSFNQGMHLMNERAVSKHFREHSRR